MSEIKKGDFVTVDTVEKKYIYEVSIVNTEKRIASLWIELPMFGLVNNWVSLDKLERVEQ